MGWEVVLKVFTDMRYPLLDSRIILFDRTFISKVCEKHDFHLNPQMALDAPRWQWIKDKTFRVEKSFDATIIDALRKRGHQICVEEEVSSFGRGQMIMRMENGVYVGGCESRTDSNIACY